MVKRNAGSLARRRGLYAPADVRFLGAEALVAQAHQLPDLIEQFRLARFTRP